MEKELSLSDSLYSITEGFNFVWLMLVLMFVVVFVSRYRPKVGITVRSERPSDHGITRRQPFSSQAPGLSSQSEAIRHADSAQSEDDPLRAQFDILQKERERVKVSEEKLDLEKAKLEAQSAADKAKANQAAEDGARKINEFIARNKTDT
ncbi:MAG: hypothetical protein V4543_07725 [Bacteroidota bacterium]